MLNAKHKKAMAAVKDGADVFDYAIARKLREVQRANPSLIRIVRPLGDYGDGSRREPYFGAKLTKKGLAEIGAK